MFSWGGWQVAVMLAGGRSWRRILQWLCGVGTVYGVLWRVSGVLEVVIGVFFSGAAMYLWSRGGAGELVVG